MQKWLKILTVVVVTSLGVAANLSAQNLTVTLDLATGYRDTNSYGGEFTAVLSGNDSFSSYILSGYNPEATTTVGGQIGIETFCVELNQYFSPGTPYSATVGPTIDNGQGSSPLTVGVAWLYMEFATGGLASNPYGLTTADYNYSVGSGRELCADELQDAIWYLQGELDPSGNGQTRDAVYSFNASTDPFVQLVMDRFGSLGSAEESDTAPGNSNNNVEVLNLTSQDQNGNTVYDQDQLIYAPVPEPATWVAGAMLLVPLGLSGLRALRHKNPAR